MKKFIVLSASLFLFIVTKSQEPHFGVKAGLNAASLNNGGNTGQTKIGFNAGAFAHIHTSLHWTIQPEILFSTEGNRYHLIGGDGQGITSLNYLNFPVLLQYMFNNGLRLEGGAQFSVLVSARNKINNNSVDRKDMYQSTAVSIPMGVSYLTKKGYGVDARYVFGLSNIYKDDSQTIQSNVFQLDIFYQFSDRWKK